MTGKRFGALTLVVFVAAAVPIPALMTDIASAQCSWMDSLTVTQLFNNPHDYRWEGSWDPKFDPDWQAHYGNPSRDYDVRCDLEYGCPTCGLSGQTSSSACGFIDSER